MKVSAVASLGETELVDVFGGYNELGLYVFGPAGMRCVLAMLIADSLVRVFGTTAEGERRAKVRNNAARLQNTYTPDELREMERERRQSRSGYGLYGRPAKPATSGRKRKAA